MVQIRQTVDYSQVTEARREIKAWAKDNRDSITAVKYSMGLQAKAQRALTAQAKSSSSEMNRMMVQKVKAAEAEARSIERLSQKYKPLYKSSMQYARSLDELADAHRLGVLTTNQHSTAVEQLNMDYQAFQNGTAGWSNQFVEGASRGSKSMNRFGMVSQQVGYQVGDFLVQVQSGQNVMVAFAQQGTQLAGLLPGLGGAVVGIGLSFAGLLYQIYRAKSGVKDTADELKTLEENLKSARSEVDALTESTAMMAGGFANKGIFTFSSEVEKAKESLSEARAELEAIVATSVENAVTSAAALGSAFTEAQIREQALMLSQGVTAEAREKVKLAEEELASANAALEANTRQVFLSETLLGIDKNLVQLHREELEVAEQQVASIEAEINALNQKNDLTAQALTTGKDSLEYLILQQAQETAILEERIKTEKISKELADRLREGLAVAQLFATVDMGSSIRAASADTLKLIGFLEKAVEAAAIMDLVNSVNSGPQYSGRGTSAGGPLGAAGRFAAASGGINVSDLARATATPPKDSSGGGSSKAEETLEQIVEEINKRNELNNTLGLQGEQLRMVETLTKKLGDTANEYSAESIREAANQIVAYEQIQEALEKTYKIQEDLANSMAEDFGDAFVSIIDRTSTVEDAFRDMAANIIKQLYEVLVIQRMVGSFQVGSATNSGIAGFLGGLFADGAAFNQGSVVPFAKGGVFGSPTTFPMAGGKTGLMGEAGPEAIMPLTRGPDGSLGVKSSGDSGGQSVVITQHFQFSANGDESVKKIIAEAAPKIAAMTKSQIIQDRRRGGTMRATFG